MLEISLFPACVVVVAVLLAAVFDVRGFRLPNALTLTLLLTGLVYQWFAADPLAFGHSLVGVVIGAVPLFVVYSRGGMGAGDVKLMAGLGAWLGGWVTMHVLIVTGMAGGVYSLALLVIRRRKRSQAEKTTAPDGANSATSLKVLIAAPEARLKLVPYGLMIAIGVLANILIPAIHRIPPTP